MVVSLTGSRVKPPKTYDIDAIKVLFAEYKFYLHDANYITEGQCVDLFGLEAIVWVDRIIFRQKYEKGEKAHMVTIEGANEYGTFRALNFIGFCELVSWYNASEMERYLECSYGGKCAKQHMDAEQRKIQEATEEAEAKRAEEKRKRHDYYLKRKQEKKAAEAAQAAVDIMYKD